MIENYWLPEWLGVKYALLYNRFGTKHFNFEDAKKELKLPEATLLKVLSDLSRKGFLIAKRGTYSAPDFEMICNGIKVSIEVKNMPRERILKELHSKYSKKYLVTGSYAAYLYHQYQTPSQYEIKIFEKDFGFWRSFDFKILPELTEKEFKKAVKIEDLFVERPENVIIKALEKGTSDSLLDAVAMLVAERSTKHLNWEKLKDIAIKHNLMNELGAVLEVIETNIEKEYKKKLIDNKLINELFTHIEKNGRIKIFPKKTLSEKETFTETAKKWRISLRISESIFEKALHDIAPFTLKVV